MRGLLGTLLLGALLLGPGCRCSRLSPEARVRKAIDGAVRAVRERDLKPLENAVSDQYSDREGNDKRQILALVRMQFLVHPNLYLLAKVFSIECPEPTQAQVVVFAAMASVPPGVVPDPRQISADVYRFEITMLDEEGTWRVVRAAWAPATVQDLF
jgi:hypothetical protein